MPTPAQIEAALAKVTDQPSFIQTLLIDTLDWPIDPAASAVEDITYKWSAAELRAQGLDAKVAGGTVRQLPPSDGCPWGIFIVELSDAAAFGDDAAGRGMTETLRKILRGLVPSKRKASDLASFKREHLLFICTHNYKHFRFAYFKDPGEAFKTAPLVSFGWTPGGAIKTVCRYNLAHLAWQPEGCTPADWVAKWTCAFDVERITKKFYDEFKAQHDGFLHHIGGIADERDRKWYISALLNRLMFVYFLQKKGFIDGGDTQYLEQNFAAAQGRGRDVFFESFLKPLFFEGFAKPEDQRSAAANAVLGTVKYLNGGLFLPHPVEQKHTAVTVPDAPFAALFELFASYSWNLDDTPGGSDNEINPDVLGYIFEKYINQKEFGAYYTRPEITDYLCENTIHKLVLEAVNTPPGAAAVPGVPVRAFATVGNLLSGLDTRLAKRLVEDVLPSLSLLDPACGSGAFLIAALKALIDVYTGVLGWMRMHGSPDQKAWLKQIEHDHPSTSYFIKKQIITRNIYGVDIMDEATEIARLRLFLALVASADKVEDLEPLPNIDFNILAGNSLIGLIKVSDGDFDAKGGQGNMFAATYRDILAKKNRLTKQYKDAGTYTGKLTSQRDEITRHNDEAVAVLNDLLLAEMQDLEIKYHVIGWDDKKGDAVVKVKRSLTVNDVEHIKPFHWAYVFDEIMVQRGGFDAIITNPPWEVFKPNGKEFFENHSELVSKKRMSIGDFEAEQKTLLKDRDVRRAWLEYLEQFPHISAYFRSAEQFENQISIVNDKKAGTDINLFKLFTEQCFNLLRDGGYCGIIIPSSIYADLGTKQLRKMLFEQCQVLSLFGISNEKFVFENVHHAFRICICTFRKGGTTSTFPAAFRIDPREAVRATDLPVLFRDTALQVRLDVETIRVFSPETLSVREFKSEADATLARRAYSHPRFGSQGTAGWNLKLSAEFHMTNDSHLFYENPSKNRLVLYEGKMISHFSHEHGDPRYWVDEKAGREAILGRTEDDEQILPYQQYRIVHRSIGGSSNQRTFFPCIVPPNVFLGHSLNYVTGPKDKRQLLYILGCMGSFTFDFLLRQSVTTNLTMFFVYNNPMPRTAPADALFGKLASRAALLTCTTPEFDDLAKEVGIKSHKNGVTDPAQRAKLRAELDGLVAHLYGLTAAEFAHVLRAFPIVPQETKDVAMQAYHDVAAGLIA